MYLHPLYQISKCASVDPEFGDLSGWLGAGGLSQAIWRNSVTEESKKCKKVYFLDL